MCCDAIAILLQSRRPSMLKLAYAFTVHLCVLATVACGSHEPPNEKAVASTKYLKDIVAESVAIEHSPDTTYRRRMKDVIARSRAVPIDSLARLFAQLSSAPPSEQPRLRQGIACETFRLALSYGNGAFERAKKRADDSLSRVGIDVAMSYTNLYEGAGPPLEMSDRACPGSPSIQLPDSLQFEPRSPTI